MASSEVEKMHRHGPGSGKGVFGMIVNFRFFVSVIVPIAVFYYFSYLDMKLIGTIAAGGWSVGVVLIQYLYDRSINAYATIGGIISAVGLIGTVISKNPTFYLASPIVMDSLLAAVFLGSLLFGKPLIQVFAESEMKGFFTERFRSTPIYRSAWTILTVGWGLLSISQAVFRIILLNSVSMETYYAISSLYGNISTPLFLAFSFWFPRWYWHRAGVRVLGAEGTNPQTGGEN